MHLQWTTLKKARGTDDNQDTPESFDVVVARLGRDTTTAADGAAIMVRLGNASAVVNPAHLTMPVVANSSGVPRKRKYTTPVVVQAPNGVSTPRPLLSIPTHFLPHK